MATPLDMDTPLAFNRPAKRVSYLIIVSDMSLKTRYFALHFCRRKFRYVFNRFTQCSL